MTDANERTARLEHNIAKLRSIISAVQARCTSYMKRSNTSVKEAAVNILAVISDVEVK